MEAKEKAKQIYLSVCVPDYCFAKAGKDSEWKIKANLRNAFYVIDEILDATKRHVALRDCTVNTIYDEYWVAVKKELENLKKL